MTIRNTNNEQGVALILTLFLMMALSVIGASLMLLSQTEAYSSLNYRLMSQARYGAESGIQRAVNYLVYPATYTAPTAASVLDPIANYDMTKSPVTCKALPCTVGQPIVLSTDTVAVPANYPVAAVQTAFHDGVGGTLTAGATSSAVTYTASAMLMSMHVVNVYGGGVQTIQTWQITADGSVTATRTATVEVTSVLETPIAPASAYGAFATALQCGALQFQGSSNVDSYDSSAGASCNPNNPPSAANCAQKNSGGNVGTNGNLGESGNATIDGTLSSPRVGVGACSAGNIDALTASGNAKICPDPAQPCSGVQAGGVVQLPQGVSLPTPTVPPGVPTTSYTGDGQTLLNGASVGNVSVGNHATLTLCAVNTTCTININSLSMGAQSNLIVLGHVILNVVGSGQATPIDVTAGSFTGSWDASAFEIQYAGTGQIKMGGHAAMAGMVYAPNAAVTLNGTSDFYGALIGATVIDTGNAGIHYDRKLSSTFYTVGSAMMSAFSWKKY